MGGISDGIIADGVLMEDLGDVTIAFGTPPDIAWASQEATVTVVQNITIGAGTSDIAWASLPVTIETPDAITIVCDVLGNIVWQSPSSTVSISSVLNVSLAFNPTDIAFASPPLAYAGELVVVGKMWAEISATKPTCEFTVTKPYMTITLDEEG